MAHARAAALLHFSVHVCARVNGCVARNVQLQAVARGLPALVHLAGTVTCDLWVLVLFQLAVQHPLTCRCLSMVDID